MKNAKKLLSMVLSLCLVLTLLAGLSAVAEGTNLVTQTNWQNYVNGEKVNVPAEGISIPFNEDKNGYYKVEAPSFAAELGKAYRLSFEYMLPEGGVLEFRPYPITSQYSGLSDIEFGKYQKLTSTGNGFVRKVYTFVVEDSRIGRIQLDFRSTKNAAIEIPAVVKNVEIIELADGAATNGSFELVEGQTAKDTTGGELIQEGALFGANMMKVTASTPLTLDLWLTKISTNAKLRGYVRTENFTADSKVTFTIKSADGKTIMEKTMNLAPAEGAEEDAIWNIKDNAWDYVRMSALPYSEGMKLLVSVSGSGNVYVDGITFENDKNLLANAALMAEGETLENQTNVTWKIEHTNHNTALNATSRYVYLGETYTSEGKTVTIAQNDGNCPDGQNYVTVNGNGNTVRIVPAKKIAVTEGEKYRISLWIKTNTSVNVFYNENQGSAIQANYPGSKYYFATATNTNGAWKQFTYTITVPKGMTVLEFVLRSYSAISSTMGFSFNVPTIEKITENEVGFYTNGYMGQMEKPMGPAFQNLMGEPVETTVGMEGRIYAKAITVEPFETSDDIVIIAAYSENENGVRRLTNIIVGTEAVAPTKDTGVKDATDSTVEEANRPTVYGVEYPAATIHTDELGDATEIRAFLWNSVSGLTPTGTAAKLAR